MLPLASLRFAPYNPARIEEIKRNKTSILLAFRILLRREVGKDGRIGRGAPLAHRRAVPNL